ncbi:MAG: hypothetical protein HOU81_23890 [Hamadaea sp.]|uniref:hypothetical protein n=1 Tax=Hamadaea sp. TaxID=2024425 RepID=UPI0017C495BC|nr:hypothetical protein [Hamadaea sp.]NUR73866.1 hypothetical protein [Hamadaea sp.]NUT18969.1 hypothetical protein [Hamadaea sp.]
MRTVKLLAAGYLGLSVLTFAAVILLRHHADIVTDAVWVRTGIVVASSILVTLFAVRAAQGSVGALRRLRILSAAMTVAIIVIVALPGLFPMWLKIEQAACGVLLLSVFLLSRRAQIA